MGSHDAGTAYRSKTEKSLAPTGPFTAMFMQLDKLERCIPFCVSDHRFSHFCASESQNQHDNTEKGMSAHIF